MVRLPSPTHATSTQRAIRRSRLADHDSRFADHDSAAVNRRIAQPCGRAIVDHHPSGSHQDRIRRSCTDAHIADPGCGRPSDDHIGRAGRYRPANMGLRPRIDYRANMHIRYARCRWHKFCLSLLHCYPRRMEEERLSGLLCRCFLVGQTLGLRRALSPPRRERVARQTPRPPPKNRKS